MDNPNNDNVSELGSPSNNDSGSIASSSGNPAKRTRISKACDACRRKKIKCDVDLRNPCSTCQQYDWECTFNDTTKKRGPPKGYIESLENRLEKMESLLRNIANDDDVIITYAKRDNLDDEARSRLKNRSKFMRYHGSSSGYHLVGDLISTNPEESSSNQEGDDDEPKRMYVVRSINGKPDYRMRRVNNDGDDFLVVRDSTADEIATQQAEDALESIDDIVPRSVLSALIYAFFNNTHTALSVVDKKTYLEGFEGITTPAPAPLLTYAICTYSCFLLKASDSIFKEAKIERDSIFQILLERATSLVRKEYLKPRIVTIQALVLLCAHPTYSTSSYRNWILAGMAVRMALDLGLHRALVTIELTQRGREKKKHLWYSVYITDRWCCAVMGRPLAIADTDCDVELPLTHGFDGSENYTMFVEFIKLSRILGEVLRRIYSAQAKSNGYKTKAIEQTVYSLKNMLDDWFLNVPEEYKVTKGDLEQMKSSPDLFPETSRKVSEGGPLTVCYHAVVLLLHRPFMVLDEEEEKSPLVTQAFEICQSSAKQSIEIARAIPYMAIAKFGWNFAAYSVFQAALIHVYNCTSTDAEVAKEAKVYVNICIEECLGPLSKDIPAGPPLVPFLQTLSDLLRDGKEEGSSQQKKWQQTFQQQHQPVPLTSFGQAFNTGQRWLFKGPENIPAITQETWQQLFSSAGVPYSEDSSAFRNDTQGLDSMFMGNPPNNNFYM